jgi:hypothetical protein
MGTTTTYPVQADRTKYETWFDIIRQTLSSPYAIYHSLASSAPAPVERRAGQWKHENICRLAGIGPHACSGGVARRIMRGLPVGFYCEAAYCVREALITQLTRNAAGTPYAGPARLAHSSQWPDEAGDVR